MTGRGIATVAGAPLAALVLVTTTGCTEALAQSVSGRVVDSAGAAPIQGAAARLLRSGTSTTADRLGRFSLVGRLPDQLIVSMVGYRPDTLAVATGAASGLMIRLTQAPFTLRDLAVRTEPTSRPSAEYRITRDGIRNLPFALEADGLRSLAVAPAVSFTSPLSARPIVRGFDPNESTLRIDGFEVLNSYHIAQSFSTFPPDAIESVSLFTAPQPADIGGAVAGVVDFDGRSGAPPGRRGGLGLSFGSLNGWAGGNGSTPWFTSLRAATLAAVNAIVSGDAFRYRFLDSYSSATFAGPTRISVFASVDNLADRSRGSGSDWGSFLVGIRRGLVSTTTSSVAATGSVALSSLDVTQFNIRNTLVDARNRFRRIEMGLEGHTTAGALRVRGGATVASRGIENRIKARRPDRFPERDTDLSRAEGAGFASVSGSSGRLSFDMGARIDAVAGSSLFSPRAKFGLTLGSGVQLLGNLGRTGRLFQIVSPHFTEPEADFTEFWLPVGNGVPIPSAEHLSLGVEATIRGLRVGATAFGSRARGLGEIDPRQLANQSFRFGKGRVQGFELQVGGGDVGAATSWLLSYAGSSSKRDFGGGWMPWGLDRTHQVRAFGRAAASQKLSLAAEIEVASGFPFTPVSTVAYRHPFPTEDFGIATYILGPENTARGAGTFRADVSARRRMRAPFGGGDAWLEFAVTNLTFGPVAPQILQDPIPGVPVSYRRLFGLPAIPTISFRMEF